MDKKGYPDHDSINSKDFERAIADTNINAYIGLESSNTDNIFTSADFKKNLSKDEVLALNEYLLNLKKLYLAVKND